VLEHQALIAPNVKAGAHVRQLVEAMRRFYRGHIVGVFSLMRCDDVVATVQKVCAVMGHCKSLALLEINSQQPMLAWVKPRLGNPGLLLEATGLVECRAPRRVRSNRANTIRRHKAAFGNP